MSIFDFISKRSTPHNWLALGNESFEKGDFNSARKYFQKAKKSDPSQVLEATISEGHSYARMGFSDQAISAYSEALKINPDLPDITLRVAHIKVRNYSDLDNVIISLDEVIKHDSNNSMPFLFKGLAFKEKMITAQNGPLKEEFRQKALDAFNDAIRISPMFSEAHFQKAEVLMNSREYALAIQSYQDSRQGSIVFNESYLFEAWCHHHLKQYNEAVRCYIRAGEIDPEILKKRHYSTGLERANKKEEFEVLRGMGEKGSEALLISTGN